MATRKNPKYDLKLKYKKVIELTLAIALLICIVLFQAFKKIGLVVELVELVECKF